MFTLCKHAPLSFRAGYHVETVAAAAADPLYCVGAGGVVLFGGGVARVFWFVFVWMLQDLFVPAL